MKPPKSILDRSFEYTPSAKTDLKKTFARVKRELDKVKAHGKNYESGTAKLVDLARRKHG